MSGRTDFDCYQRRLVELDQKAHPNWESLAFGLLEEAGEVAGKIKRLYRDGTPKDDFRWQIRAELGDVLAYTAMLADALGLLLSDIAHGNISKLEDRVARGTYRGSGDDR